MSAGETLPPTLEAYFQDLENKNPQVHQLMEEYRNSGKPISLDPVNQYVDALQQQYEQFAGVKGDKAFVKTLGEDVNEKVRNRITEIEYYKRDSRMVESFAKLVDAERVNLNPMDKPLPEGRNPLAALLVPNLEEHLHSHIYPEMARLNAKTAEQNPEVRAFHVKSMADGLSRVKSTLGALGTDPVVELRASAGALNAGETVVKIEINPERAALAKNLGSPENIRRLLQNSPFEGATAEIVTDQNSGKQFLEIRKPGIMHVANLADACKQLNMPLEGGDTLRLKAVLQEAQSQGRVYVEWVTTKEGLSTPTLGIAGTKEQLEVMRTSLEKSGIKAEFTNDSKTVLQIDADSNHKAIPLLTDKDFNALPQREESVNLRTKAVMAQAMQEGRVFKATGSKQGMTVQRIGIQALPGEKAVYENALRESGVEFQYSEEHKAFYIRSKDVDKVKALLMPGDPENNTLANVLTAEKAYAGLPSESGRESARVKAIFKNANNEGKLYKTDVKFRDAQGVETETKAFLSIAAATPEEAANIKQVLIDKGFAESDLSISKNTVHLKPDAVAKAAEFLPVKADRLPDSLEAAKAGAVERANANLLRALNSRKPVLGERVAPVNDRPIGVSQEKIMAELSAGEPLSLDPKVQRLAELEKLNTSFKAEQINREEAAKIVLKELGVDKGYTEALKTGKISIANTPENAARIKALLSANKTLNGNALEITPNGENYDITFGKNQIERAGLVRALLNETQESKDFKPSPAAVEVLGATAIYEGGLNKLIDLAKAGGLDSKVPMPEKMPQETRELVKMAQEYHEAMESKNSVRATEIEARINTQKTKAVEAHAAKLNASEWGHTTMSVGQNIYFTGHGIYEVVEAYNNPNLSPTERAYAVGMASTEVVMGGGGLALDVASKLFPKSSAVGNLGGAFGTGAGVFGMATSGTQLVQAIQKGETFSIIENSGHFVMSSAFTASALGSWTLGPEAAASLGLEINPAIGPLGILIVAVGKYDAYLLEQAAMTMDYVSEQEQKQTSAIFRMVEADTYARERYGIPSKPKLSDYPILETFDYFAKKEGLKDLETGEAIDIKKLEGDPEKMMEVLRKVQKQQQKLVADTEKNHPGKGLDTGNIIMMGEIGGKNSRFFDIRDAISGGELGKASGEADDTLINAKFMAAYASGAIRAMNGPLGQKGEDPGYLKRGAAAEKARKDNPEYVAQFDRLDRLLELRRGLDTSTAPKRMAKCLDIEDDKAAVEKLNTLYAKDKETIAPQVKDFLDTVEKAPPSR